MGFTPEEARLIPFGCCEAMLSVEIERVKREISNHKYKLQSLYGQLATLETVDKKSWELKTKYAKGELP